MAIRNSGARKNVAVLMGGPSAEYEVSINTGKMVLENLDKEKYDAKPVVISRDGFWPISREDLKNNFDVVFIAMHGEYGEDGTIQTILEEIGIPYTGSGPTASKLGMEKIPFSHLMAKNNILVPEFCADKNDLLLKEVGLPIVVKPADRGSSVGVTLVKNWDGLSEAITHAKKYSKQIMFQKYIKGREFTCGVIEKNGKPTAILPTEIIPKNPFFDYEAKYVAGASQEITPPSNMDDNKIKELQNLALRVHQLVGCNGYSRTDFIIDNSGKIYTLEINTLPGMTAASLLPGAAKVSGIEFSQLLDIIIENALL
ncbi:MAG: D-alanine--D-alanine ligase [Patescibacteria group bacterium]